MKLPFQNKISSSKIDERKEIKIKKINLVTMATELVQQLPTICASESK